MKKNRFYYIFILTISFFIISNLTPITAAEETLFGTALKTGENTRPEDRNFFEEITKKVQDQIEKLINKAQEKTKQSIKEKSKNFVRNRIEWVKDSLSPLKIKIQQGSDIIKKEFNKLGNYLKDLF